MAFCENCGSNLASDNARFCSSCGNPIPQKDSSDLESPWLPTFRASAEEDFEDRLSETGWVYLLPFERSQTTDFLPWMAEWVHCLDEAPDTPVEDWLLRGAASRGSIHAMARLMTWVYESEQDDWEAWRWAKRIIFLLGRTDRIDQITDEEILASAEVDAAAIADNVETNMPITRDGMQYVTLPHAPNDVGLPSQFNYCLSCGKWKSPSAPLDQCDDSVHLVKRHFGA